MDKPEVFYINKDGSRTPAIPEPYYPSFIERILHAVGIHQWTYDEPKKCVMCGITNSK